MSKRFEIKLETEETIVLREGSKIMTAFCPSCGEGVLMASPQVISVLSGITEREVFRLLEVGKIHFTETGGVLICLNSLRHFRKGD